MDPSYNNSFASFGSGGGVPGGGVVGNGVGTGGDIILSSSGEKKSKKWLLIGALLFVIVLSGVGIFALLHGNGIGSGGQLSREETADVLGDQSVYMAQITQYLEMGLVGGIQAEDFFDNGRVEEMNEYISVVDSFKSMEKNLNKLDVTGKVKQDIDKAVTSLNGYSQIARRALVKLNDLVLAFLNSDYDGIEKFATENNLELSAKVLIMDYAREYATAKPLIDKCKEGTQNSCSSETIREYYDFIDTDMLIIKEIFSSVIDNTEISQMKEYNIDVNKVMNYLYEEKKAKEESEK